MVENFVTYMLKENEYIQDWRLLAIEISIMLLTEKQKIGDASVWTVKVY